MWVILVFVLLVDIVITSPTYFPSLSPHSISVISTIAGTGAGSFSGDGGQATSASMSVPSSIDFDNTRNVYFTDYNNHRVRKITVSTGIISTFAGTGSSSYSGDGGFASSAAFYNPGGLCLDSAGRTSIILQLVSIILIPLIGNMYIADSGNHRIRKITASTSVISTIAGTGSNSYGGDNSQATAASMSFPVRVAVDTSGKCK